MLLQAPAPPVFVTVLSPTNGASMIENPHPARCARRSMRPRHLAVPRLIALDLLAPEGPVLLRPGAMLHAKRGDPAVTLLLRASTLKPIHCDKIRSRPSIPTRGALNESRLSNQPVCHWSGWGDSVSVASLSVTESSDTRALASRAANIDPNLQRMSCAAIAKKIRGRNFAPQILQSRPSDAGMKRCGVRMLGPA